MVYGYIRVSTDKQTVENQRFEIEGFCWIDVNSTYLKARIKANGVFDVLSMSLFTMPPPSLIGTLLR